MAKTKKKSLKQDYNNWWAVAGDIYGGKVGQRGYAALKAANPGVDRFYRGMTIKVPDIDPKKVKLSHAEVARERGEFDYGTGQPTQDYWNARGGIGQPPGVTPPSASPEGAYPQAISPGVIELSTGARMYAPYPWQAAQQGGKVGSMGGIQPSAEILYDQFYGTQLAQQARPATPPPEPFRAGGLPPTQRGTPGAVPTRTLQGEGTSGQGRRFEQGQYGAQFGGVQDRRAPRLDFNLQPLPRVSPAQAIAAGRTPADLALELTRDEQRRRYRYGGADVVPEGLVPDIEERTARAREADRERFITGSLWGDKDHTWLAPWIQQTGVDLTDPASIALLDQSLAETLFILGLVQPAPVEQFAVRPAATYSGYTGYTPPKYYRGSSSTRSGRGSYSYPQSSGGTRRYDQYMNLVSWTI